MRVEWRGRDPYAVTADGVVDAKPAILDAAGGDADILAVGAALTGLGWLCDMTTDGSPRVVWKHPSGSVVSVPSGALAGSWHDSWGDGLPGSLRGSLWEAALLRTADAACLTGRVVAGTADSADWDVVRDGTLGWAAMLHGMSCSTVPGWAVERLLRSDPRLAGAGRTAVLCLAARRWPVGGDAATRLLDAGYGRHLAANALCPVDVLERIAASGDREAVRVLASNDGAPDRVRAAAALSL